jgi:hypothetical protein
LAALLIISAASESESPIPPHEKGASRPLGLIESTARQVSSGSNAPAATTTAFAAYSISDQIAVTTRSGASR